MTAPPDWAASQSSDPTAPSDHPDAGGIRTETLPSAEIDSAGTAYMTWADCGFRAGCPSNDIVLAKSTSETTWGTPTRVPIDATTSTVDHFVPGIGVDPSTSGATARIGLTYYFYPATNCTRPPASSTSGSSPPPTAVPAGARPPSSPAR